ncbi:hypothetical protein GCM10009087_03440 [Sphingomonas oligophenolica]|uniref:Uncharacterized protein n=1 Tax=Sphingomonas oligophenolica TaxID=301154 RepID=A0ABU9Y0K3_9SPHN
MASILSIGTKSLDLLEDAELIVAAGKLIAKWPAMPDVNDGRSLIAFLDDGGAKFRAPAIKAAFDAAGLGAAYKTVSDGLGTLLGKVDAAGAKPIARLFDRLDRFQDDSVTNTPSDPGLVSWQPLALSENAPVATGFALGLEASAAIEFEAGDQWPYAQDSKDDPSLTNLLRIGARGSLKGTADASMPLPIGSLKLGASASGSTTLAWYFRPANGGELFGLAVAESLPKIPSPVDFDQVWNALAATDATGARLSDLKGIDLHLDGSVEFAAEVALALGSKIQGVGAVSAGLGVSASVSRASRLQLSMRAIGKGGFAITLTRGATRSSTFGMDLSVTLDATELAEKVAGIVNQALDSWDKALDPLRPYLSPGTLLRTLLADRLEASIATLTANAGLQAALLGDAQRALGLSADAAGLVDWVSKQITDAVSRNAAAVRKGGDTAIDAIVADLGPTLAGALAHDTAAIRAGIGTLVSAVETKTNTAIKELFNTPGVKLGDLLNRIGVQVSGAVTKLDDATAAVRKLFDLFDEKVALIRAATAKVAAAKLQLSVTAETSLTDKSDYLIAGTFTRNSDETRALFAAILAGKGPRIVDLLMGDTPLQGFTLDKDRSFLTRSSAWQDRTAYSLIVFGFGISGSLLLSARAAVTINARNEISVVAEADAESEAKRADGSQILSFSSPYAWSSASGPSEPVMTVNIGVDRFEKDLQISELTGFLGTLLPPTDPKPADPAAEPPLPWPKFIDQQAIDLATAKLGEWGLAAGSNRKVPARVKLGMVLDFAAVKRLMRLSARNNGDLPEATRIEIVHLCLQAFARVSPFWRQELAMGIAVVRPVVPGSQSMSQAEIAYRYAILPRSSELIPTGTAQTAFQFLIALIGGFGVGTDFTTYKPTVGKAFKLIDALAALGDLYEHRPVPIGTWTERDYRKAEQRVADGVGAWLTQSDLLKGVFKLNDTLSREMTAFLLLVATLGEVRPVTGAGGLIHIELSNGADGQDNRTIIV